MYLKNTLAYFGFNSVFELLLFDFGNFFPCFIEKIPKFGFAEKSILILIDVEAVLREYFLPNLIFINFYMVAIRFLI
jgi:hypothetical protein